MSRTGTRNRRILERLLVGAALLATILPAISRADEYDPPGRVARLKFLQGSVSFQPAGDADWVGAAVNRPTTTGDRLWTDPGARAELSTGSATIRLAGATGFSFLNLDDRTVQIELTQGTLGIRVRRLGRDEIFEVDTPNQAFTIQAPGQYRFEASEDGATTVVTVRRGQGEATGAGEIYPVSSGQSVAFTGMDPLRAEVFEVSRPDEFDAWSWRRDRRDDRSRSARYVSRDVVGYEDLDDYGSWRPDPQYGNVWFPTRVSSGWAPYREGHWAWISPWGWTWVDDQPWGYAPFHYGRWVHVRGAWGWVPGPIAVRPVYAPALVAFIGGPGFAVSVSAGGGNVGWFPLGPGEVYVPAYRVSPTYVNRVNVSNTTVSSTTVTTVYNTHVTNNYVSANVTYVNRTAPGAVTAVPHAVFTSARPVARAAVTVNAQQVVSAPVGARAAVAPTRESVLGIHASTAERAARPPPAIVNRPVVAKAPPPPPPVPFAKQREALAAHPGQPLAPQEADRLRPPERAAHPLVRQAPPGRPATPEARRPPGQPGAARPGQPAPEQPSGARPGRQEMRTDRPQQAQPGERPQPGNKPAVEPGQPSREPSGRRETRTDQPAQAKPGERPQPGSRPAVEPGQPAREPPPSGSPGNREMRTDRPPQAQPGERSQPGSRPAVEPGQPSREPPGRREMRTDRPPQAQPGERPQPGNKPAVEPGQPSREPSGRRETRTDQPAQARPGERPQPGSRPAVEPGQPSREPPSGAPPGRREMRTDRPPQAQPKDQPARPTDAPSRPGPQADRPQKEKPEAAPQKKAPRQDEHGRKEEETR